MSRKLQIAVTLFSVCLVGMLLLGAVNKPTSSPEETYRHIGVFTEVLSKIKSDYVEEPDMKNVTLGAVNGLLESLDPYASYLTADQFKQWQTTTSQKKASVGLVIAKRFGYVAIVDSIPGSPADKAGLSTGDMIETIQGVNTRDMPLAFAEMMLAGDAGSSVELGVLRFRDPEPTKIALVRSVVAWPAVSSKMLSDGIGYLQVPTLAANRIADVKTAVQALEKQGAKKLILDLRNCATGEPEAGIELARLFLGQGLITYAQGQKAPRSEALADAQRVVTKLPLVVATNRGTAGGAEITAAALLENRRAEVVGERTYGDAAVRKPIVMDDGSAVILSVAKYYTPVSTKAIQDNGVLPSVPVADLSAADTDNDEESPAPAPAPKPKSDEDPILKKAIEVSLKGLSPEEAKAAEAMRAAAQKNADTNASGLGPLNIPTPK